MLRHFEVEDFSVGMSKASGIAREQLVSHSHLLLAALAEGVEQCMSERLRDEPEGGC